MMQSGGPGGKVLPARSEIDISSVDDAETFTAPVIQGKGGDRLKVEVMDVTLGLECQVKESLLFFWVSRGRIEFHLVYKEAFYGEELMTRALDIVTSTLKKELQIEEKKLRTEASSPVTNLNKKVDHRLKEFAQPTYMILVLSLCERAVGRQLHLHSA